MRSSSLMFKTPIEINRAGKKGKIHLFEIDLSNFSFLKKIYNLE